MPETCTEKPTAGKIALEWDKRAISMTLSGNPKRFDENGMEVFCTIERDGDEVATTHECPIHALLVTWAP